MKMKALLSSRCNLSLLFSFIKPFDRFAACFLCLCLFSASSMAKQVESAEEVLHLMQSGTVTKLENGNLLYAEQQLCNENFQQAAAEAEFRRCWYIGTGVGVSHIDADESVSKLGAAQNIEDHNNTAFKVYIGRWLKPSIAAEISYHDLGSASYKLTNIPQNIKGQVNYKVFAAQGVWLLQPPHNKFQPFAKLGAAHVTSSSDKKEYKADKDKLRLLVGFGAQQRLSKGYFVRGDVDVYSDDQYAFSVGVGKYLGYTKNTVEITPVPANPQ